LTPTNGDFVRFFEKRYIAISKIKFFRNFGSVLVGDEVVIGTLQLELRFFNPQSLKEKRVLLKSLVSRIRKQFNVAIAEIDGMDLWQTTTLAIAAVGGETKRVNQILDYVREFICGEHSIEIMKQQMEFF